MFTEIWKNSNVHQLANRFFLNLPGSSIHWILNTKKEQITESCNNMDESQIQYAKKL